MVSIRDWKISHKIWLIVACFAAAALCTDAIAVLGQFNTELIIRNESDTGQVSLVAASSALENNTSLQRRVLALYISHVSERWADLQSDVEAEAKDLRANLDRLESLGDAEERAHIALVRSKLDTYLKAEREGFDLKTSGRAAELGDLIEGELSSGFKAMDEDLDWLSNRQKEDLAKARAHVEANGLSTLILSVAVSLLGLVAGAAGALILAGRFIVRPLTSISTAMQAIMEGDVEARIDVSPRADEVGVLARTAGAFAAAARRLKVEAAASVDRESVERERQRREREREQEAAEVQLAIDEVGKGLKGLAAGHLTHRITVAFAGRLQPLKDDFNAAMAQLLETMTVVARNTQAIRGGTTEISGAADDLSARTEHQAAVLEETSAALEEVTSTVRHTAEGAAHARRIVGTTKEDAEVSGRIVREAVTAMAGIEASSRQIGRIIGVIDEIAFQTSLLALNAGVEAARAGDAGKGFAVVASEVRALAQRSAEAAKEIKTLVSASTAQVDQGVARVGETGKALERIVVQVAEINGIVTEIANAMQTQATSLDEVNKAVNEMDKATQQNAAMVEETTAASHTLVAETQALTRLIARFRIGVEEPAGAHPGVRRASPPPRRAAAAMARPASAAVAETWAEF